MPLVDKKRSWFINGADVRWDVDVIRISQVHIRLVAKQRSWIIIDRCAVDDANASHVNGRM
jgi:hypothetical protein